MKDRSKVYVIQEIPGTRIGRPKINIMGAQKHGDIKVLLKEDSQIIFSPGPIIYNLRQKLKNFTQEDYFQPLMSSTSIFFMIILQGLQYGA